MFDELVSLIAEKVDGETLLELVDEIWQRDRSFTYPRFMEACEFEAETARAWGLEGEVLEAPADGKTVMGEWRMPLAWDCEFARAEIVSPKELAGRVIADTDRVRAHVVMWSGPTPEEGLFAPLIYVKDANKPEAYEGLDVRGKVVLTDVEARQAKMQAVGRGAAAVISHWTRYPETNSEAVQWVNGWSDDPGGWAFHEGDTPLPALSISLAQGRELKELLERHGEIEVKMAVKSRYYEGVLPSASFLLRGSEDRHEVLVLGHGQEQGANDNASGIAAIMTSLRVLNQLIDEGRLARPARSIRGLAVSECYGTYAFGELHPEIIKRTLCALNLDSIGETYPVCRTTFNIMPNPHASVHYSDGLILHLAKRYLEPNVPHTPWREGAFGIIDNGLADPAYGVPTVAAYSPKDLFWHTSADTLDKVDPEMLRWVTVVSAAFLYTVASADAGAARRLAGLSLGRHLERLGTWLGEALAGVDAGEEKAMTLARLREELLYRQDRARAELATTKELVPAGALSEHEAWLRTLDWSLLGAVEGGLEVIRQLAKRPPEKAAEAPPEMIEAEKVVPVRCFRGTPCFDSLPREVRTRLPSPRWDGRLAVACFWADGKRTLAEVARLATFERGGDPLSVVKAFRRMAEHGLVEMKQAFTTEARPPQ